MDGFWKVIAGVLLAVILGIVLHKKGKDISSVLTVAVCCMVFAVAVNYLQPVVEFARTLQTVSGLDSKLLSVLFKAVGVCLLSEIAVLVCQDAGNASLGKVLQVLTSAVVLWLSLPLLQELLGIIQKIVGEI